MHSAVRLAARATICALLLVCASAVGDAQPARAQHDSTVANLRRDVGYLASAKLNGRATGSAGGDSAAQYLAQSYVAMQVDAVLRTNMCDSTGRCRRTYFQPFRPPADVLQRATIDTTAISYNVIAAIPGTDSSLASQWIVIGGHYDHLGTTGFGARDRAYATEPHLGADDNASGTAAVLELARRFARTPARRPVMFVNFGAEEIGEIGSYVFVLNSPIPLDSITAMFNFDMVGHLGGKRLQLYGLGTSLDWQRLVDSATTRAHFALDRHSELGPKGTGSDHDSFARVGVPAVHFFTGAHSGWHTKDDTIGEVDFDGMARIVDFAESFVRLVGSGAARPARALPR